MRKIQFDNVNGVEEVEEFMDEAEIVEVQSVEDLTVIGDGLYGAIVSEKVFLGIKEEFGLFR